MFTPLPAANNATNGPLTTWVKYNGSDTWVPVTDPAMLPVGNTTAEFLVIGKDGNRSTAGPVTLVVAPVICAAGFFYNPSTSLCQGA
jgi:hypothetical protein